MARRAHVVIVGAGFGGLACAQALARADVDITLVDRRNHHLFQPLLYQVAMSGLRAGEIAVPTRAILRKQANARVSLAEVAGVDLEQRRVRFRSDLDLDPIAYDYLVLAPGARPNYHGNEHWAAYAPALKNLDDAMEIRRRVLLAFEAAEQESDPARRARWLSFVVVGGGPAGVELAAAIAELARATLGREFHHAHASELRVLLIEGRARVLPTLAPALSDHAVDRLADLGVHVRANTIVDAVEPWGVQLRTGERLHADTVLWAAGVAGATLLRTLSPSVELDRQGRAMVLEDCSVPGFGETFVVGDAACMFGPLGDALPSVGAAAMQMGRYVGQQIAHEVADPRPSARPAFCYVDPGVVVTLGRGDAVAVSRRKLLAGRRAWWQLVPHLWRLAAFGGRSRAFSDWALAYLRYRRGARIIMSERAGFSTADHAYQQGVFGALEEDSQVRAALGRH